ncbi:MAG: aldehyde dehydrogenase family protein, partial [Gammaproteobacteria bacterium]|nr:aldehyde dehydrogenase family protein [Gammaproteobacteria bacterium]NNL51149.1 aldehyde dehydrogenase family protein [Woeseiaceae bacterium]
MTMQKLKSFATVDPFDGMSSQSPGRAMNLVNGNWVAERQIREDLPDPMTGKHFIDVPDTEEIGTFLSSLANCPKTGLHNPLKNTDRYVHLGRVCARAAALLVDEDIEAYFTRLIQRVMPKSWQQCVNEVLVTRVFLENFAGDGVRFLGRGFSNPGDATGQESRGYRWPFGPVVVIAPFNFPLEIPALQALGALFMGNRPLVKVDSKVSVVFEQFLRLLIHSGLSPHDVDLIHCRGERMGELLDAAKDSVRMIQFTGSSHVAEAVAKTVNGAVRLEDAGFDWKVIGPDFDKRWLDYVAWQSDEDAYNASGQKCSAQSILFVHENWSDALLPKLGPLAARRNLNDLSIGPVLSWNNEQIKKHIDAVLEVPGAELMFGGSPIAGHSIPARYGAYEPTAIRVPLAAICEQHFELLTTELFGPFQIIATYANDDVVALLGLLERISHHLTAAVVSADPVFQNRILSATVNGTTYCGMRARTTGAPQNHWFGPSGDPRAAG